MHPVVPPLLFLLVIQFWHTFQIVACSSEYPVSLRTLQLPKFNNVHRTWWGHHTTGGYPTSLLFNSLPSTIPTWQLCRLLRWEQC